jgi:hypothetical protein
MNLGVAEGCWNRGKTGGLGLGDGGVTACLTSARKTVAAKLRLWGVVVATKQHDLPCYSTRFWVLANFQLCG